MKSTSKRKKLILQLSDVCKRFGGVVAADQITLELYGGETFGLIGPNGAGKTTLLNLITGIYASSSGTITLNGKNITKLPTHKRARLGIARTFNEALYKAFLGAGIDLPKHRQMIITVKDADKGEAIEIGRRFERLGYKIYATRSTAKALNDAGVKARKVNKIHQESPTVMDLILGHKIDLVIDTPTQGRDKSRDGFLIRRTSIETGVNCITALDTAKALATSLENKNDNPLTLVNIAEL